MKYFLVSWWVNIALHFHFRRIHIAHKERTPLNGPLIFSANHKNSMVDAAFIAINANRNPWFLVRGDLFNNPKINAFLRSLYMLPIYRTREGYNPLKANQVTFKQCENILQNAEAFMIFPEGIHHDDRHLRPLKKGLARIAFSTYKNQTNEKMNIYIQAVGLEYSKPELFREDIHIQYGEPISLTDYIEIWKIHPSKAIKKLNDDLHESMQEHLIHISSKAHYELINQLLFTLEDWGLKKANLKKKQHEKFMVHQALAKLLCQHLDQLDSSDHFLQNAYQYLEKVNTYQVKESAINKDHSMGMIFTKVIILILLLPIFLWSVIHRIIPILITQYLVKHKSPGHLFNTSIRLVSSLVLFPLNALILGILIFLISRNFTFTILYFFAFLLSGLIAAFYYDFLTDFKEEWRYFILKIKSPKISQSIQQNRNYIIQYCDNTIGGLFKIKN